ncbi:hypothetical protein GDO86_018725 [Hymenochirus boettgeri]|uniref:Uncharacterized protein n=1 Tax=Hymenochirus boettgeri TaxID=247094 RepID=A0A8T2ILN1_9PIPI|nr:hypothetical protein GDO86_018725 [Hymenochirus boettgeri]
MDHPPGSGASHISIFMVHLDLMHSKPHSGVSTVSSHNPPLLHRVYLPISICLISDDCYIWSRMLPDSHARREGRSDISPLPPLTFSMGGWGGLWVERERHGH